MAAASSGAAARPEAGLRILSAMFDKEVIDAMRREFDAADKDGNGQLDAQEACELFARSICAGGSTVDEGEVRKTAASLMNQMDADKSGTISFEEYCFRFGRRYQVEAARRRRAGLQSGGAEESQTQPTQPQPSSADTAPPVTTAEATAKSAAEPGAAASAGAERAAPSTAEAERTRFVAGSLVVLQELRGAPQLNGRQAKVLRFDESAGRYVVELEGEGGQKSLRPENLKATRGTAQAQGNAGLGASAASTAQKWVGKAKVCLQQAMARVQLALAEYEWWQIALGAALVLLFALAYFQVQGRYQGPSGGGQQRTKTSAAGPGHGQSRSRYADENWEDRPPPRDQTQGGRPQREAPPRRPQRHHEDPHDRYERRYEEDRYREREEGYYDEPPRRDRRPSRHNRRYDDYDDYDSYDGGYGRYGGQAPRGNSGLLGEWGQLYTMLIIGGLGYLCWTGIIPVHRMSWFQIYMLWNIIEPLLLGGRGRGFGGGFGGLGRRRRGFF